MPNEPANPAVATTMEQLRRPASPEAGLPMIRTVVLLVALSITADAADLSLLDDAPLSRLQRCYRRCEREHGPMPTAVPTASPTPPPVVVPDCSDGTFGTSAYRRTYEPGRLYKLCLNVPADAVAPAGILQLDSVNHSNVSCNIYALGMTSPTGKTFATSGSAPVLRPSFERGKWGVTIRLDPHDAPCANNPGLSIWAYWF